MTGDGKGKGIYFSLGDLEVTVAFQKKKLQRPIGRRWLIAMINMVEMETID